jgi:hypothetical protein
MTPKAPLTMARKAARAVTAKAPLTMEALATELLGQIDSALGPNWRQTFVHVTFGIFMGGLALLLALLYAGVPIIGS